MKNGNTELPGMYSHFSVKEREEIAIGLELGESLRSIAKKLGRNVSSISREIKRNNALLREVKYRANRAQLRADERKEQSHGRERLSDPLIRLYVEFHLVNASWTPEEIAGRLPIDIPGLKTNYESIYLWIYKERRDLIKYLVRGHKRRHKRGGNKKNQGSRIPNRRDLSERPEEVNKREEGGHWEVDTVVSRQGKSCVAVLVERNSRFYIVIKIKDKTAQSMYEALMKVLSRFPGNLCKTLTYDNGLENALHEQVNMALGTESYFCKPYHSWEKGSIENRNGVLRRSFPKKHNWDLTEQKEIDTVINKINLTPMKCLSYKTPAEVFAELGGVALAG
jgi:IS30 family transposase